MSRIKSLLVSVRGQLSAGRATRDLLSLISGTMAARVVQVLTVPIIARLFDPADYGRISIIVALATTLNQGSSLGYEGAIVLPRQGHGARQVSRLAICLLVAFCAFVALAGWAWPAPWRPASLASLPSWWLVLAVMIALLGFNNVLQAWAIRRKSYAVIARSTLAQASVSSGGRVAWGLGLGPTMTGLITPYLVGLAVRGWCLARSPSPSAATDATPAPVTVADGDPGSIMDALRQYAHFALFGLPSALIRSVTQRLPLLLIGALFAPAVAGFYAAANRLVLTSAQAVGQAGRQVAMPRAAGRRRRGEPMFPSLVRATLALSAIALLPFAVLYAVGDPLLVWILGDGWASAGPYAQPLAPWGFSMLLVGPISAVFQALEQQRWMLAVSSIRLGLFIAAAALALYLRQQDPLALVWSLAIAGVLANMLQLTLGLWLAWRYDRNLPSAAEDAT